MRFCLEGLETCNCRSEEPFVLPLVLAECRLVKSLNYGKMAAPPFRGSPRAVVQLRSSKSPTSGKTNQVPLASSSSSLQNTLTNTLKRHVSVDVCALTVRLRPDGNSCYLSPNTSSCDCLFLFPGSLPNKCCSR